MKQIGLLEALAAARKCEHCQVTSEAESATKMRYSYRFCEKHEPPQTRLTSVHIEIDSDKAASATMIVTWSAPEDAPMCGTCDQVTVHGERRVYCPDETGMGGVWMYPSQPGCPRHPAYRCAEEARR